MKTVVINGKEWKLAYNLRSLFIYEEIAGHPFSGAKTIDVYTLLYAMLQANNKDFSLSFEELIDACDADMGIFQMYLSVMDEYGKRMAAFVDDKKKAVTQ